MSDEVTAPPVETPATETATPTEAPLRGAKFWEAMKAHGAEVGGDDAEIRELAKEAAPAGEPAKPAPKPAAKAAAPATDSKLEQLKALARELDLTVEDGAVISRERAEWREKRRQADKRQADKHETIQRELEAKIGKAQSEVDFARQMRELQRARDYDGLAKAWGFPDWNALQRDHIAQKADPGYAKQRQMEEKLAEIEREKTEAKQAQEREERRAKRAATEARLREKLDENIQRSKDPVLAAFAQHPLVAASIFEIQRAHYEKLGLAILTNPEKALDLKVPGAAKTLREELRELAELGGKAFGGAPPAAPAAPKRIKTRTDVGPATGIEPSSNGEMDRKTLLSRLRHLPVD